MDVIEKHSFLSLAENFIQNKHKGHTHACTQKKKTASSAIRTRKKHKHVTVLHDSTQYTWEQILIAHKNIMHTSGPYCIWCWTAAPSQGQIEGKEKSKLSSMKWSFCYKDKTV